MLVLLQCTLMQAIRVTSSHFCSEITPMEYPPPLPVHGALKSLKSPAFQTYWHHLVSAVCLNITKCYVSSVNTFETFGDSFLSLKNSFKFFMILFVL